LLIGIADRQYVFGGKANMMKTNMLNELTRAVVCASLLNVAAGAPPLTRGFHATPFKNHALSPMSKV
jgi:hypothetical protein